VSASRSVHPRSIRGAVATRDRADSLSGWVLHPTERGDFYHRIRVCPDVVSRWRDQMAAHIMSCPERFQAAFHKTPRKDVLSKLDEGISLLREVARILALTYGTPRLGNKADPVDELVYIILARKTREDAYQRTFDALKTRFPEWDDLLLAPRRAVARFVHSGGLSAKKTGSLFGALGALRDRFGSCTLTPARRWTDAKLEEFLCSLPELSRKSAYCIMMYSFGRMVFPVDTHVGRILARLGPYRELGLSLAGLDHKGLQAELADLVPPNLRYSLHVNLVAHGRAVCRATRPLCEQCELRNFCAHFRAGEARRVARADMPTVVDLFGGCGGMSEGFTRAGFRTLVVLDHDPVALKTYRLNHPHVPDDKILCRDIEDVPPDHLARLAGRQRLDVLVGSPPCQGFSHVGSRSKPTPTGYRLGLDDRNHLFEYLVAAAVVLRPRLLLMENVPGMQSAKQTNLSFLEKAAQLLERKGGFQTSIWRLNAAAFGVPQVRVRYFLVASHMGELPSMPPEEYQDIQRHAYDLDALPPVTLDDAIFDLSPRDAGTGQAVEDRDPPDPTVDPRYRRYLGKFNLLRS
jgi:DNA (cytosine-5)-methyltransferase 1